MRFGLTLVLFIGLLHTAFAQAFSDTFPDRYTQSKVNLGLHAGTRLSAPAEFVGGNTTNFVSGTAALSQAIGLDVYFPMRVQKLDFDVQSKLRFSSIRSITQVNVPIGLADYDHAISFSDKESVLLFDFQLMLMYAPGSNRDKGLEFGLGVSVQNPGFLTTRTVRKELYADGVPEVIDVMKWQEPDRPVQNQRADPVLSFGYRWPLQKGRMAAIRLENTISSSTQLQRSYQLLVLGTEYGGRQEIPKSNWVLSIAALLF